MSLPREDAAVLAARWTEGVLLKRDVFSTVERGRFRGDGGEVDAVLRRLDSVPWWSYLPARHLFARERRALAKARGLNVGPELLWAGREALVRGFIDGVALHLAKPSGNAAYFDSAKQALHKLHRAGICHNDLAKEQNWLVGRDGRAYLTDFQLAACFRTRGRLFRIAAYEDLRHLLKHKRSYAPEALTPMERKILARKSLIASIWPMDGCPIMTTRPARASITGKATRCSWRRSIFRCREKFCAVKRRRRTSAKRSMKRETCPAPTEGAGPWVTVRLFISDE